MDFLRDFFAIFSLALFAGCGNLSEQTGNSNSKNASQTGGLEEVRSEDLVEYRVLLENLDTPSGLAVQPDTGHVFVSLRKKIVRIVVGDEATAHEEIVGFAGDEYGRGPTFKFGPLGLLFLPNGLLAVGDGGKKDGDDLVYFFELGNAPLEENEALTLESASFVSGPFGPSRESKRGEGNYFGLAANESTIFATSHGDDTKGWISTIKFDERPAEEIEPFIESKVVTELDAPGGIVLTSDGSLLASQIGELNEWSRSVLAFYDASTGELKQKITTDLHNITDIAFSPKTNELYAIDFSWSDKQLGGLFRLKIEGSECTSTRLAYLVHPVALEFDEDGNLYISVIGEPGLGKGQVVVVDSL